MEEQEGLVRQMEDYQSKGGKPFIFLLGAMLIILLGSGTGYLLSSKFSSSEQRKTQSSWPSDKKEVKKGEIYGLDNLEVYRDKAVGVVKVNDKSFTDEGSHVLIRDENNPSQNAYLTSTVLDLNLFIERKVEVRGETFAAQKAGWLMDVGRVEVLE